MASVKRKEPENVLVGFRVTQSMKDDIDRCAAAVGVPYAVWLRDAVREKMEREEEGMSGEEAIVLQVLNDPDMQDKIIDALGERLQPMIEVSVRRALDKIEDEERT